MTPEIHTGQRAAIALALGALVAIVLAIGLGRHLEDALHSSSAATILLGLWCLVGVGVAIAAIVDAFVRPEGETLGLVVTIVATVFVIASLLVIAGIVAGATSDGLAIQSAEID